eukprot:12492923-Ditylum_brightwellii.AAC.1
MKETKRQRRVSPETTTGIMATLALRQQAHGDGNRHDSDGNGHDGDGDGDGDGNGNGHDGDGHYSSHFTPHSLRY